MSIADDLPDTLPAMELVTCAGITYRQLDYWTTQGYLRPDERPDGKQGTGYNRSYPESELDVATRMRLLVDKGLTPRVAAVVARSDERDTEAILMAIERADNNYSVKLDPDRDLQCSLPARHDGPHRA